MKIIKLKDLLKDKKLQKQIIKQIRSGAIFIYPTDTIYGIGCNALNSKAVKKIRKIKKTNHPFSVITPSKKWILKNFIIKHRKFLQKLPGRYTLIFRMKGKPVPEIVSKKTLGLRIPAHQFTKIIQKARVPFVTTSANLSGEPVINQVESITFSNEVDFIIDGGILKNPASTIFDLTDEKPKKIR